MCGGWGAVGGGGVGLLISTSSISGRYYYCQSSGLNLTEQVVQELGSGVCARGQRAQLQEFFLIFCHQSCDVLVSHSGTPKAN